MSWSKKIHVESSIPPREGQYAMFIGRWQPLHAGHKALFQGALDEGKNVLICIRDGAVNEKIHLHLKKYFSILQTK
jgi:phosphopantetheine adenylyltransferase